MRTIKSTTILMILALAILAAPGLFAPPAARAAGIWYVAPSPAGNDGNDCSTPSTPCASINAALNKPGFVPGDTVRVAVGTYTGTGTEVVLLNQSATLSGGWDAAFASQTGLSTIDGEGARRVIDINGSSGVINLDLLVIQNGATHTADGGEFFTGGAGIFCRKGPSLNISRSTIQNNNALAPLNNSGGGFLLWGGPHTLTDSTVSANSAADGAGIYLWGSLIISNSLIKDNVATSRNAGGILISTGASSAVIRSTSIVNNAGTGVYNFVDGTVTISNSTISGNSADEGGGIYNRFGTMNVKSTTLC